MNWQDITWIMWAQIAGTIAILCLTILGFFIKRQVTLLHVVMNSKMDILLNLTKIAAKAEGKLEEQREEAARAYERAKGAAAATPPPAVTVIVPPQGPDHPPA